MINLLDVRNHTEVVTGFTKDAMLNKCADEIESLRALLQEFVALCALGDVDDTTEALGWGDLIQRAKKAVPEEETET